jgi:hypothetical protein
MAASRQTFETLHTPETAVDLVLTSINPIGPERLDAA